MSSASQQASSKYQTSGGSDNASMAELIFALASASAMGAYTGKQPLETVFQHCESLVGTQSKAVKKLRQQFAGELAAEAK
jgi:hypothetical protein